jgi:hypothetical protein
LKKRKVFRAIDHASNRLPDPPPQPSNFPLVGDFDLGERVPERRTAALAEPVDERAVVAATELGFGSFLAADHRRGQEDYDQWWVTV